MLHITIHPSMQLEHKRLSGNKHRSKTKRLGMQHICGTRRSKRRSKYWSHNTASFGKFQAFLLVTHWLWLLGVSWAPRSTNKRTMPFLTHRDFHRGRGTPCVPSGKAERLHRRHFDGPHLSYRIDAAEGKKVGLWSRTAFTARPNNSSCIIF